MSTFARKRASKTPRSGSLSCSQTREALDVAVLPGRPGLDGERLHADAPEPLSGVLLLEVLKTLRLIHPKAALLLFPRKKVYSVTPRFFAASGNALPLDNSIPASRSFRTI
jgi:hypothetical protein